MIKTSPWGRLDRFNLPWQSEVMTNFIEILSAITERKPSELPTDCYGNVIIYHMRIAVRLPDSLLRKARKKAAEEGRTLASLIQEGLGLLLCEPKVGRRAKVRLPVSKARGGTLPGVDLNLSSQLEDAMQQDLSTLSAIKARDLYLER